jgi:hypothetical protein
MFYSGEKKQSQDALHYPRAAGIRRIDPKRRACTSEHKDLDLTKLPLPCLWTFVHAPRQRAVAIEKQPQHTPKKSRPANGSLPCSPTSALRAFSCHGITSGW